MDVKDMKKILAGVCMTGLIAGSSLAGHQLAAHASSG